ncbi:MAG TPA: FAD-dependent oxidoreductase [Acidimicrobiia bacterium]|nr:FAD-dependent oxidoreductase [Acidimicrobiia bacterium]
MKSEYRVVVIGGGVVGASVAYHLAKLGWNDVAIVERSVLTAGSSWHAAGGVHALNADPNIAALQAYTIDLLSEIEKESGQDIGMHMTGGISVASAPERWEWLQAAYRIYQTMGIEDVRLMKPAEIKELCPIINLDGVLGGLWADREGYIDPSAVVHAYARAARGRGADVIEQNRVLELKWRSDGYWDVLTEKGTITAEHVVNAAGLWAKQVGRMAGVELPLSPLAHHYLITEQIPELAALDSEIPMMIDLEGFTYMRQELNGLLVGIYEINHRHWNMDGAPWDYGLELIPPDVDRISDELAMAMSRYPILERTGINRWVNGAFTFSPDGNPLVGPVPGLHNYWSACAVMAGFLQGGGVGKSLAEWMIQGEPEEDIFGMDVARFGSFAENREYIRQMTGQFYSRRFVMTYPNEQLWAGRPLRMAPAYDAMTAAGAHWGSSYGLEVPIYFAPREFSETPTLRRSNAFDIVGEECRQVRSGVGILDISSFSRYEIAGPNAEPWLDNLLSSRLPAPGRIRLAPMLGHDGRLKGDLTLLNWGDGTWWIMGSYYLRSWHMRWFNEHLTDGVSVRDISDGVVGFSLSGPKSQELLGRVTDGDVSSQALPFMSCGLLDVGLIRARVGRISVTGELGYEIHCSAAEHIGLRRSLVAAGAELGAIEYGYNALLSLRTEKSFGIWSAEFRQEYTPAMTGLDRWIDWSKDFIGAEAASKEHATDGAPRKLVTLEVDATDADASGYEPVWHDGTRVGFITSGDYGHTLGRSLAMALVDREHAVAGSELSVHIVGEQRPALVVPASPYDPAGAAMRAR